MAIANKGWIFGLLTIGLIFGLSIYYFTDTNETPVDDPWAGVPVRPAHVDHTSLMPGPYATGQEVTAACLTCHEDAANQIIHTAHWKWESEPVQLAERDEPVTTGKKNSINNFCIGIQGNWASCTACHVGYGWEDETFDFSDTSNVDCLVCHERSGMYKKGKMGVPVAEVNLVEVAQSVGVPGRENCGGCHFRGGGGDAVKHGDLDESLLFPSEDLDIHMGRYDFSCVDCHQTENHQISGRSISVSMTNENQVYCTDCHNPKLHKDDRLNQHTDTVACQTCHIPALARKQPTKTFWDWSQAGDDSREEDPHEYLKIKGSFVYEDNVIPLYRWFNGTAERYILGDEIDTEKPTPINLPRGELWDPKAKIWPFKRHIAIQPYDSFNEILLQPMTSGEGGFWKEFDWNSALQLGAEAAGLDYSGEYDFTETHMYWPTTHMVAPKEKALQCRACHSENGRMNWQELGYPGDPARWGATERDIVLKRATTGSAATGGSEE
jgi:octaheme c-type cytochrome (tetrathionate reductase family)